MSFVGKYVIVQLINLEPPHCCKVPKLGVCNKHFHLKSDYCTSKLKMAIYLINVAKISRACLRVYKHLLNWITVKANRWFLSPVSGNVDTATWFGEFASFSSKAYDRFEVLSPCVLILLLIYCGLVTPYGDIYLSSPVSNFATTAQATIMYNEFENHAVEIIATYLNGNWGNYLRQLSHLRHYFLWLRSTTAKRKLCSP